MLSEHKRYWNGKSLCRNYILLERKQDPIHDFPPLFFRFLSFLFFFTLKGFCVEWKIILNSQKRWLCASFHFSFLSLLMLITKMSRVSRISDPGDCLTSNAIGRRTSIWMRDRYAMSRSHNKWKKNRRRKTCFCFHLPPIFSRKSASAHTWSPELGNSQQHHQNDYMRW